MGGQPRLFLQRMNVVSKIGGSYAHGTPNEKSDLDLVVQLTEEDEGILRRSLGLPEWGVVRVGKLNLIVARTDD